MGTGSATGVENALPWARAQVLQGDSAIQSHECAGPLIIDPGPQIVAIANADVLDRISHGVGHTPAQSRADSSSASRRPRSLRSEATRRRVSVLGVSVDIS